MVLLGLEINRTPFKHNTPQRFVATPSLPNLGSESHVRLMGDLDSSELYATELYRPFVCVDILLKCVFEVDVRIEKHMMCVLLWVQMCMRGGLVEDSICIWVACLIICWKGHVRASRCRATLSLHLNF